MKKKVYLTSILVLIAGVLAIGFYYSTINPKTANKSGDDTVAIPGAENAGATEEKPVQGQYLFTGKIKLLNEKLDLFNFSSNDREFKIDDNSVKYYEAGEYATGKYKGYKRIIALKPAFGMGIVVTPEIFATKDFKTYVWNLDPNDPANADTSWYSEFVNKAKVTDNAVLDQEHMDEIRIDDKFVLVKSPESFDNLVVTESHDTGKKDGYGNQITEEVLKTDFTDYTNIKSNFGNLAFYVKKITPYSQEVLNGLSETEKEIYNIRMKYLGEKTQIVVVDSTGLGIRYTLTTKSSADQYKEDAKKYVAEYPDYKKKYDDATIKRDLERARGVSEEELTPYPDFLSYPGKPNLRFSKSDTNIESLVFNNYDSLGSSGCGGNVATDTVKLKESDLEKIGALTKDGIDIYKLKDPESPLYKLAYDSQIGYLSDGDFLQIKGIKKPTFEEYSKSLPLLVIKDPWGRFAILQEEDDRVVMGCGKPVVYLYPPKPTEVKLQFLNEVKFNTDIPKYTNGWDVLAQSNGTLEDLQPQYTDCSKIDVNKKGSDYALKACQENKYPYLYWAGQVYGMEYPAMSEGWVVSKGELAGFLHKKLDEIGFNKNEKKDFLDYWLSELQAKNGKYYRISFLQNKELNSLIPMKINPIPDSIYRYFIDYSVLDKPVKITPQKLQKIERDGFTLVEWGGVKK